MAADIPPQRHRCLVHEWCTTAGPGHRTHVGEVHVLTTERGTELRVALTAEDRERPVVQFEAVLDEDGPPMEVADLDAAEAVELAGFLLRAARVAQVERNETR